jgi:lactoylglutathione lyase
MKVDFVTIHGVAMAESINFYTEVLGFSVARDFQAGPGRRIAFLSDGPGTQIELISDAAGSPRAKGRVTLGFHVKDVSEIEEFMRKKGVPILRGPETLPSGVRMMWIEDPNGVELAFVQQ